MTPEERARLDAVYAGKRESLRPVADALIDAVAQVDGATVEVGDDRVDMLANGEVFGIFSASSARRVTLRLRLQGTVGETGRFVSTADKNPNGRYDMQAQLAHPSHVDDEVRAYVRRAAALTG